MSALAGCAPALALVAVALAIGAGQGSDLVRAQRLAAAGRIAAMSRTPRRGSAPSRVVVCVTAFVASVALVIAVGPLALGIEFVGAVVALLVRDGVRRRAADRAHRDVAEAVRLLVAELEAGASLSAALRAAAEVVPAHAVALRSAAEDVLRGDDMPSLSGCDEPALRAVGHACRVASSSGAGLAVVLTSVAREVASLDDRRRALAAAAAAPRASCALLAGLPLLGVAMGSAMGADPPAFLFGSPVGRSVCLVGLVLDGLGMLWLRRIVRSALAP